MFCLVVSIETSTVDSLSTTFLLAGGDGKRFCSVMSRATSVTGG